MQGHGPSALQLLTATEGRYRRGVIVRKEGWIMSGQDDLVYPMRQDIVKDYTAARQNPSVCAQTPVTLSLFYYQGSLSLFFLLFNKQLLSPQLFCWTHPHALCSQRTLFSKDNQSEHVLCEITGSHSGRIGMLSRPCHWLLRFNELNVRPQWACVPLVKQALFYSLDNRPSLFLPGVTHKSPGHKSVLFCLKFNNVTSHNQR